MKFTLISLGIISFLLTGCNTNKSVLEVTSFKLQPTANDSIFNDLDSKVETIFTSKQAGFIKRQSAVTENGEYVVLVYWNTQADADASMQKFMKDESVADYAAMINGSTMKMNRYEIEDKFNADNSNFVEVMSFETKEETDLKAFNITNKKVEKGFTAKQEGFLQRITGVDENGKQVVAIYWDNKSNSDAALQPFMENPISKEFMGMMQETTIQFGRYQTLTSLAIK